MAKKVYIFIFSSLLCWRWRCLTFHFECMNLTLDICLSSHTILLKKKKKNRKRKYFHTVYFTYCITFTIWIYAETERERKKLDLINGKYQLSLHSAESLSWFSKLVSSNPFHVFILFERWWRKNEIRWPRRKKMLSSWVVWALFWKWSECCAPSKINFENNQ